jgi:hypothetical protein
MIKKTKNKICSSTQFSGDLDAFINSKAKSNKVYKQPHKKRVPSQKLSKFTLKSLVDSNLLNSYQKFESENENQIQLKFQKLFQSEEQKMEELLEGTGLKTIIPKLKNEGVHSIGSLKELTVEHFNALKIPAQSQKRISSAIFPEARKSSTNNKENFNQNNTKRPHTLNQAKLNQKPKYFSSKVKRNVLTCIKEQNENSFEGFEKIDINQNNWLLNLGNDHFDFDQIFSSKKNFETQTEDSNRNSNNVHQDENVYALEEENKFLKDEYVCFNMDGSGNTQSVCYSCFSMINGKGIKPNFENFDKIFCSTKCLQSSLKIYTEICSICLKENNKLEMEFHLGEFICTSFSCKLKLRSLYNNSSHALKPNKVSSEYDSIFNF